MYRQRRDNHNIKTVKSVTQQIFQNVMLQDFIVAISYTEVTLSV